MITVGIRDLKNRLSEYLRLVRAGEDVLVTDRGEVVAELRRAGAPLQSLSHAGLYEPVRHGGARLGSLNHPELYPALPASLNPGEALDLLDAERGPA